MTATVDALETSVSCTRPLPGVSLGRILWAADFSPCAEDALRFAVPIARAYGSTVTALHVVPATIPAGASAAALTNPALLRPHLHHDVSESLDRAVYPLQEASVPVGIALRAGDPGDEILGMAAELHADLLVVGRHGRRLIERAVLGSVAEQVLGRARCPVLVVPVGATRPLVPAPLQTIVWATDFSPHAARALCYAASLAVSTGARLVLLNVVEGNLLTSEREAVRQARLRLVDSVHACRSSGCDPETVVTVGSAAGEIARVATERSAGLVVMGVQGARTHAPSALLRVDGPPRDPRVALPGARRPADVALEAVSLAEVDMEIMTPAPPAEDAPTSTPSSRNVGDRWEWWEWWLQRKEPWVRDVEPQLDADVFRAICAGTGLPPIHQRSNFAFHSLEDAARRFAGHETGGHRPYSRVYTRLGNPTTEYLERIMVDLEAHHVSEKAAAAGETEPTIGALIFSSGMAAISTLLLSLLRQGDALLLGSVYGGTDSLARGLAKFGIEAVFCDTSDLGAVEATLGARPDVAAVLLESPENPTLGIADIRRISWLTEARGIPLIVDNTFCSPYLQQPLRLGADFVVHSLTKFVNGHSSSIAGAVVGPFRFMRGELFRWYHDLGPSPSPFESWLNALCLQDLAVRLDAQCDGALRVATFLRQQPQVARVDYPGFDDFPQRGLVRQQMRRGGSLIAFELRGGQAAAAGLLDYLGRRDTPTELAVSLGSSITYVEHPASMTHASVPEAERLARGITPGLVRLSVGLEGPGVLIEHLRRALAGV